MIEVSFPVNKQACVGLANQIVNNKLTLIQSSAIFVGHLVSLVLAQDTFINQLLRIEISGGRVLANNVVHQWLCGGRLIGLVVTATAVANQIDNHVFAKLIAIVHR